MSRSLATVLCLLALRASPSWVAAIDLRPELETVGLIDHLTWTAGGDLWFGTDAGQVYVSRDSGRGWSEVPVLPRRARKQDDYEAEVNGDTIHQVVFFDARRGLALGWWRGSSQAATYRTTDGGASWQPVQIPGSFLVNDAQATPEGRAWLVGSAGEVATSEDYGATWRLLTSPACKNLRSVVFTSPAEGLVGTDGTLFITGDGGASWRRLPDPETQGYAPGCTDDGLRKIRRWGDWLLVNQCDRWFARPFPEAIVADGSPPEPPQWRPLRVDGKELLGLEPMTEQLLAIAGNGEIVYLDRALQVAARSGFKLRYQPLDIAVHGDRIAILDKNWKVTVGERESFARVTMLREGGAGEAGQPKVFAFDRGKDGVLWGISTSFLYRSPDAGRTWERQAELPSFEGDLALRPNGEVVLWSRNGNTASYDPRTGAFTPVPELAKLDVVGFFRRGDLWLAYGGWQQVTDGRVLLGSAVAENQFAGSSNAGFVAASTDGGGRWQMLDRWVEGSGTQAALLADDDTLTLLSWLGSFRRGKLTIDKEGRASAALTTVFQGDGNPATSYGESAEWVDFLAGDEGWLRGWSERLGFQVFRTRDGGRTWKRRLSWERPFISLSRLGGGVWVAQVRLERRLVRWNGKKFRRDHRFGADIAKTWTDSTGALLVTLENGELWSLDAKGASWTRLR